MKKGMRKGSKRKGGGKEVKGGGREGKGGGGRGEDEVGVEGRCEGERG